MKIVLFLGAGFSQPYGLPVMQEFFNHVKNAPYLSEKDKDFFTNYRKRTNSAADTFEPDYDNLEDVLSFCLALESFVGHYPEDTSDDYKKLCRILFEVYRHVREYNLDYWNLPRGELRTFMQLQKGRRKLAYELTIITTNYDIIVEYLLCAQGLNCRLPTKWKSIENKEIIPVNMYSQENEQQPLLCKLHGSINWFPSGPENLNIEGGVLDKEVDTGEVEERRTFPLIATKDYRLHTVPLIIPPTIFKLQVDPCLQRIWGAAGIALMEADKLIFIGFSFPDSDIYIRYFLAANLAENANLEKIRIIDPKADEICNKLRQSGSKFGNRFKKLLESSSMEWFQARDIMA